MASLRQRMLEDMQVRRLSACTQRTYVETVARFARYFDRSPARLGPEQIRAYQVYLTNERRLAPSSLVVAVSALRFLYRVTLQKRWVFDDMIPAPKKPRSLPVVLSPEEVVQFLDGVKAAKHHAILTTCYAAGLRISEATPTRSGRAPAARRQPTSQPSSPWVMSRILPPTDAERHRKICYRWRRQVRRSHPPPAAGVLAIG